MRRSTKIAVLVAVLLIAAVVFLLAQPGSGPPHPPTPLYLEMTEYVQGCRGGTQMVLIVTTDANLDLRTLPRLSIDFISETGAPEKGASEDVYLVSDTVAGRLMSVCEQAGVFDWPIDPVAIEQGWAVGRITILTPQRSHETGGWLAAPPGSERFVARLRRIVAREGLKLDMNAIVQEQWAAARQEARPARIMEAAFDAGRKILVTCDIDGAIDLWTIDPCLHRSTARLPKYPPPATCMDYVSAMDISPRGDAVATLVNDTAPTLWSLPGLVETVRLPAEGWNTFGSLAFSRDGSLLFLSSREESVTWDIAKGQYARRENSRRRPPVGAVLSPDGGQWTWLTGDGVSIADAASFEEKRIDVQPKPLHAQVLAYNGDGRMLAAGGNCTVVVWGMPSGALRLNGIGHIDTVNGVAFSPNGRTLASCSNDRTVRLWDLETGEMQVLRGHGGPVLAIAFSPDGNSVVSVSAEGNLIEWEVPNGKVLRTSVLKRKV